MEKILYCCCCCARLLLHISFVSFFPHLRPYLSTSRLRPVNLCIALHLHLSVCIHLKAAEEDFSPEKSHKSDGLQSVPHFLQHKINLKVLLQSHVSIVYPTLQTKHRAIQLLNLSFQMSSLSCPLVPALELRTVQNMGGFNVGKHAV